MAFLHQYAEQKGEKPKKFVVSRKNIAKKSSIRLYEPDSELDENQLGRNQSYLSFYSEMSLSSSQALAGVTPKIKLMSTKPRPTLMGRTLSMIWSETTLMAMVLVLKKVSTSEVPGRVRKARMQTKKWMRKNSTWPKVSLEGNARNDPVNDILGEFFKTLIIKCYRSQSLLHQVVLEGNIGETGVAAHATWLRRTFPPLPQIQTVSLSLGSTRSAPKHTCL